MSTPSTEAAIRRRRLVVWWITSLSLLAAVLLGFTSYYLVSTLRSFRQTHHTACLPSDFPTYSNIVVQEVDESFAVPGSLAQCRVRMSSRDVFESVNGFYHVELNVNDWKITSYAENSGDSTINFARRSRVATSGVVSIDQQQGSTEIQVQLTG